MTHLSLRDYQNDALESVQKELENSKNRQLLVVMPTGSGKTPLMVAITQHYLKKTLILSHRDELIHQAHDKFKKFWPTADVGICKAERNELDHQIVIASVQTASNPKRLEQLKKEGFAILLIDECHHAPANTYQKIIKELGFTNDSSKVLIGFTATANRSDKKQLGNTFDKVVYEISTSELIAQGWLTPVIGRRILTNIKLKKIKTSEGDFIASHLSRAINIPERNTFIVQKYLQHAYTRQAIAFCADVKHCQDLAEEFNKQGIKAAAVWGSMPLQELKKVLDDFKNRVITVLTSCSLLTEGVDLPSVNAILMSTITRSHSRYVQSVGRGLRIHPGKENCIVLDFSDIMHTLKNGIITLKQVIPEATIVEEQPLSSEKQIAIKKPTIKPTKIVRETDQEFDILGSTHPQYLWVEIGDNELSLTDDDGNEIVLTPAHDKHVAILYNSDNIMQKIITVPLPFMSCIKASEEYAQRNMKITFADTQGTWISANKYNAPTDQQKQTLFNYNKYSNAMGRVDAYLAIRTLKSLQRKHARIYGEEPITPAQKIVLRKAGVDTLNMTKKKAMTVISQLKREEALNVGLKSHAS